MLGSAREPELAVHRRAALGPFTMPRRSSAAALFRRLASTSNWPCNSRSVRSSSRLRWQPRSAVLHGVMSRRHEAQSLVRSGAHGCIARSSQPSCVAPRPMFRPRLQHASPKSRSLASVSAKNCLQAAVWRDNLDERRATNKMRGSVAAEGMMPALIDAGNGYCGCWLSAGGERRFFGVARFAGRPGPCCLRCRAVRRR